MATVGAPADAVRERKLDVTGAVSVLFVPDDDIAVRFYRATGDEQDPWSLYETVRTIDGSYATKLPRGTYRATINELDDHRGAYDLMTSATWTDFDGDTQFSITDQPRRLGQTSLLALAGRLSGTVKDQCGVSVEKARVEAYDPGHPGDEASAVGTVHYGSFTVNALGPGTKLRVVSDPEDAPLVPGWWRDSASHVAATTFEQATTIAPPPVLSTSSGHDLVVRRAYPVAAPPVLVSGWARTSDGRSALGVTVRLYRLAGPDDATGTLQATVTSAGRTTSSPGTYQALVPPGDYRVTYDEEPTDPTASTWMPASAPNSCVDSLDVVHTPPALQYRQGLITGKVVDATGAAVRNATVEVYPAESATATDAAAVVTVKTGGNGSFAVHGAASSTRLRFLPPTDSDRLAPIWFGGAKTPGTSTVIHNGAAGASTTPVSTTTLPFVPIRSASTPKAFSYTGKAGGPVAVKRIRFVPHPRMTHRFTWYRSKGDSRTLHRIRGAHGSTYFTSKRDVGYRFRVRVTASYPGVKSLSVMSTPTPALRRK